MAFRIRVSGPRACFVRPEFRIDRISYEVITPLAARAIYEAIYWRPQMRWCVDVIHVLNPIYSSEENRDLINISQCNTGRTISLVDVDYLIDAHFDIADDGNAAMHSKMFRKRARSGRYFREPYLGVPGYPATIELMEDTSAIPHSTLRGSREIGWMVHDLDDTAPEGLRFFQATMKDGTILVPPMGSPLLAL